MLVVAFVACYLGSSSALNTAVQEQRQNFVAANAQGDFGPNGPKFMRRQLDEAEEEQDASLLEDRSSHMPSQVDEGSMMPWLPPGLQADAYAHKSGIKALKPSDIDPCYVDSVADLVDSEHNKNILHMEHNECMNALNLDSFIIQATVKPDVAFFKTYHGKMASLLPLHFSSNVHDTSRGISIGEHDAQKIVLKLADGEHQASQDFPLEYNAIQKNGADQSFSVECAKTYYGRQCRVAVNGKIQGGYKPFNNISGNVYNMDGYTFGANSGWGFKGYLTYISVCQSKVGGLSMTTITTTLMYTAEKCKARVVHSRSDKQAMCADFPCADYDLIHVSDAKITKCFFQIDCRPHHDLNRCCVPPPFDPTFMNATLYTAAGIIILIVAGIVYKWLKFVLAIVNRKWKVKKLMLSMDARAFLDVPEKINYETGQTLRDFGDALRYLSQQLIAETEYETFYPEIVISCALGQRKGDAAGCGPGMYHSLALSVVLLKAGIPCFAPVMVPAKLEESEVLDKIVSKKAHCLLLMVVQSEAMYDNRHTLVEIYGAQKLPVPHILPLSFMTEPAGKSEQWPMIEPTEYKWLNMRMAVQDHFGKLASVPEAPTTMSEEPKALLQVRKFARTRMLEALDENAYISQIPKRITLEMGDELRRVAQRVLHMEQGWPASEDMHKFWPEVYIIFAPGPRKDKMRSRIQTQAMTWWERQQQNERDKQKARQQDAKGCGPGMYYTLAVQIALVKAGIPCLSSMMCRGDKYTGPDTEFRDKMLSKKSKCKVVLVVNTEDIYYSKNCLRHIHSAQKRKIPHILPLSFGKAPPEGKQWEHLHGNEELEDMRDDVQAFFCQLPLLPRSGTVFDSKEALPSSVEFVKKVLDQIHEKEAEEKEKKRADEKWKKRLEELKKALPEACICGEKFKPDAKFCLKCGTKRADVPEKLIEQEKAAAEAAAAAKEAAGVAARSALSAGLETVDSTHTVGTIEVPIGRETADEAASTESQQVPLGRGTGAPQRSAAEEEALAARLAAGPAASSAAIEGSAEVEGWAEKAAARAKAKQAAAKEARAKEAAEAKKTADAAAALGVTIPDPAAKAAAEAEAAAKAAADAKAAEAKAAAKAAADAKAAEEAALAAEEAALAAEEEAAAKAAAEAEAAAKAAADAEAVKKAEEEAAAAKAAEDEAAFFADLAATAPPTSGAAADQSAPDAAAAPASTDPGQSTPAGEDDDQSF